MESRKITKKETEYFEECPICKKKGIKKEIIGSTESQVKFNLDLHLGKHKREEDKK